MFDGVNVNKEFRKIYEKLDHQYEKLREIMSTVNNIIINTIKKKKKDPDAPKRSRSAWIIFRSEKIDEFKKDNPNVKAGPELSMRVLSGKWHQMTRKEKKPYEDKAKEEKIIKDKERKEYELKKQKNNKK
jgi:hypothetical protein